MSEICERRVVLIGLQLPPSAGRLSDEEDDFFFMTLCFWWISRKLNVAVKIGKLIWIQCGKKLQELNISVPAFFEKFQFLLKCNDRLPFQFYLSTLDNTSSISALFLVCVRSEELLSFFSEDQITENQFVKEGGGVDVSACSLLNHSNIFQASLILG